MPRVATVLAEARTRLENQDRDAALEAEILLAHALDTTRTWLRTWPEREVSATDLERFLVLLARRIGGEPVAYLTGTRGFWSLDLAVTPATLIPRPDTELLVELALKDLPPGARVADLGTGSGAIALALTSERPDLTVIATDADPGALAIARKNAGRYDLSVTFLQGDWCSPLPDEGLDLIVSNPPYIAETDPHLDQGDLRFEPRHALASGADGLDDIRIIIGSAPRHLRSGGRLLLEHGWEQGEAVRGLLRANGYSGVASYRDLAGHQRVSGGAR